jgi:hypothetical protein
MTNLHRKLFVKTEFMQTTEFVETKFHGTYIKVELFHRMFFVRLLIFPIIYKFINFKFGWFLRELA